MNKISIKVNAKINLSLDVTGKREDGYHTLDMLMASVDVSDFISAQKSDRCSVTMDGVAASADNTAVKALRLLNEKYGINMSVRIAKGIPVCAGMGGSSADASGIFFCAHKLYGIPLRETLPLAMKIGSDVAYMTYGGGARARGAGEIFEREEFEPLTLVVCQKIVGASTKEIYAEYDKVGGGERSGEYYNALEKSARKLVCGIGEAREDLSKFTDRVFMTGSGSAYVGVFDDDATALKCLDSLRGYVFKTLAHTVDRGIEIVDVD